MAFELECKIRIPDRDLIAAALNQLGAEDLGELHEKNWLFDTPDGKLKASEQLLRLRRTNKEIITFKGPALASAFKNREEIEMKIGSIADFTIILKHLGFAQVWFYEKLRHSFTYRDCKVVLDKLPELGNFIEVEGDSEEEIKAVLADLGLDHNQHLEGTYHSLFRKHCRERGEELRDLRFNTLPRKGRF
ncbi:MAG: class IV adenylate cyclase [Planctomycetes bacterium]|nr:class IV adenylate cyclase [Planctomycetota bacterium]